MKRLNKSMINKIVENTIIGFSVLVEPFILLYKCMFYGSIGEPRSENFMKFQVEAKDLSILNHPPKKVWFYS